MKSRVRITTPQNPTSWLWSASTVDSPILVPTASTMSRGGGGHGSVRMGVATARGGEERECMKCAIVGRRRGVRDEETGQDKTLAVTWTWGAVIQPAEPAMAAGEDFKRLPRVARISPLSLLFLSMRSSLGSSAEKGGGEKRRSRCCLVTLAFPLQLVSDSGSSSRLGLARDTTPLQVAKYPSSSSREGLRRCPWGVPPIRRGRRAGMAAHLQDSPVLLSIRYIPGLYQEGIRVARHRPLPGRLGFASRRDGRRQSPEGRDRQVRSSVWP